MAESALIYEAKWLQEATQIASFLYFSEVILWQAECFQD
jgi:hypothetical protein